MAQVTGFDRHRFEVERFQQCFDKALRILMQSADEWALGNPEMPRTRQVMNGIMEVFAENGFLTRPYGWNTD